MTLKPDWLYQALYTVTVSESYKLFFFHANCLQKILLKTFPGYFLILITYCQHTIIIVHQLHSFYSSILPRLWRTSKICKSISLLHINHSSSLFFLCFYVLFLICFPVFTISMVEAFNWHSLTLHFAFQKLYLISPEQTIIFLFWMNQTHMWLEDFPFS